MTRLRMMAMVFSAIILAGSFALSFPLSAEEEKNTINDIKYKIEDWDPRLLQMIELGPYYLSKTEDIIVMPPPANDSTETRAELDLLLKYQAEARTSGEVEKIIAENIGRFDPMFSPKGTKMKEAVTLGVREVDFFLMKAKKYYGRARPTQLEPELTTVIPVPKHAAYPSGHGTQARMAARILTEIDPANKESYEQYARDVAHRREVAGLHYPSDSKAGSDLADAVFEKLIQHPQYKKTLEAAKEEFKHNQQSTSDTKKEEK
ncbi:MAG: hypothetical protein WBK77_02260 [Alphaproteobacteria bacterium]